MYPIVTGLIRLSILLFYLELVDRRVKKVFTMVTIVMLFVCLCYMVIFTALLFTACRPFESEWLQADPKWLETHKFHCNPHNINYIFTANALAIPQDFIIAFSPLFLLAKLQVPMLQKISLIFLFGMVFVASIGSIMKTYYNYRAFFKDDVIVFWKTFIWTNIEVYPAEKPHHRIR